MRVADYVRVLFDASNKLAKKKGSYPFVSKNLLGEGNVRDRYKADSSDSEIATPSHYGLDHDN